MLIANSIMEKMNPLILLGISIILSNAWLVATQTLNINHSSGGVHDDTDTILLIPHSSFSLPVSSQQGHSPLSSGIMHILTSSLFQPTLKLFGAGPLFSTAMSEALGCIPPCTCKLDFLTQESEMVCRGLSYPELLGSFLNASSTPASHNPGFDYPPQNDTSNRGSQTTLGPSNDVFFNDLWRRNRGRENREKSSVINQLTTTNPPFVGQGLIDKQKGYYESAGGYETKNKRRNLKFSSLTFTFNSIPTLKRELFSALKATDTSENGINSIRELYFYYNKIKAIDADAFLDFERPAPISDPKYHSDSETGIKRIKIVEHAWHTDPQDYFSGFPFIALLPLKSTLEELHISSPNIGSVALNELSQFIELTTLTVKSSGLKTLITNSTFSSSTSPLPPSLQTLHLSTDSMDRVPVLPIQAINLTYFSLTSTILTSLSRDDFFNNLPALEHLFIIDSNLSEIAFDTFSPLKATLQTLDLRGNRLSNLDARTFLGLTFLKVLDLSGNELATIPNNSFRDLQNLQTLSLKYNRIIELGDIMGLGSNVGITKGGINLRVLFLRSNSLTKVPETSLRALTNLRWLDLSKNRITHLSSKAFSTNRKLQKLDLASNLLDTLEPGCFAGPVKTLFDLKLYHNRISYIASSVLSDLQNLTHLDLSYNNLSTISVELFQKSQDRLTYMDIAFNPWNCDCKMKEFRVWMESRISNLFFLHRFKARTILNRAKCDSPPNMAGVPLSYPPLNAFVCHDPDPKDKHRATLIHDIDVPVDPGYNYSANVQHADSNEHYEDLPMAADVLPNPDGDLKPEENPDSTLSDPEEQEFTNKELTAALFRQQTIDAMLLKEIRELYDTMLHLMTGGKRTANISSYQGSNDQNHSFPHTSQLVGAGGSNALEDSSTGMGYSRKIKDVLKQGGGSLLGMGADIPHRSAQPLGHLIRTSFVFSTMSLIIILVAVVAFIFKMTTGPKSLDEGNNHECGNHSSFPPSRSSLSKPTTALNRNGDHDNHSENTVINDPTNPNNGFGIDEPANEYMPYNYHRGLSSLSTNYAGGSTCSLASRNSRGTLTSSKFNQWTGGYKRYLWRAPLLGPLFRPSTQG